MAEPTTLPSADRMPESVSATAPVAVDTCDSEFMVEAASPGARITGVHDSLLQDSEKDILWYRDVFLGRPHWNFLAFHTEMGPLAVSVIQDGPQFKLLLRTTHGAERLAVDVDAVPKGFLRKLLGLRPNLDHVMLAARPTLPVHMLRSCRDIDVPGSLLAMEERQVIRSYKFGVLYMAPGQSTEQQVFENQWGIRPIFGTILNIAWYIDATSPGFRRFLNFLGERIDLRGWTGYRAGLDISESLHTGKQSYYTKWQGYEIMFHVAPLLPYSEQDKQQLERKRHIGNDIVVILYQESELPFQLSTLTSKQNHLLAVVQPHGPEGYQLTSVLRQGVPPFHPPLPLPAYFERDAVSRDFFLHKLVNGERACYKAPGFSSKIARTRSVLLAELAERFVGK